MSTTLELPHPGDIGRDGDPLVRTALDPANPSTRVVGWGGRRLAEPLARGDMILRERLGGGHSAIGIVIDPAPVGAADLRRRGMTSEGPGPHVQALLRDGSIGALRVAGPDGLVLADLVLLRAVSPDEAAEILPPLPPPRPMIRRGSSGPAVAEAQTKLNRVHVGETAQGRLGLDACPLNVDAKFGPLTQRATISFQKLAFPGQPKEWDGIVGPKTWAKLDAYAPNEPPIIPPVPPVPPVPPLPIDPPIDPPIIPVVDRPLDPSRWGPILRRAASSSAVIRSGNAVRPLIEGRETFLRMVDDIKAADGEEDYIYLLGWGYFDNFDMGGGNTARELLKAASNDRKVQVRVMLWAMPPGINLIEVMRINGLDNGAAIRDDETANKTALSTAKFEALLLSLKVAPALIPIILATITEKDLARLGGSHHQKLLVVKRKGVLVGYCGGIDIAPNRINVTKKNKGEEYHDDHCRVRGPSAWDLLETFVRRWNHHPESAAIDKKKGALRGASEPVPKPLTFPAKDDAPFGTTTSVAIARTFNPVHKTGTMVQERDIRDLLNAAVRNANRFIYLEDQYMIDLDMAKELNAALKRIEHLTILIPGNDLNDMPFGAEYRRDFVEAVRKGHSSEVADRLRVFQLSTSQTPPPVFGQHTYLHAKSWVFDDELAVIGSANCNRRGYQHDSEVNAFIFDDPIPQVALALREQADERAVLAFTFAQRYRMALWSEHLGVPGRTLSNALTSANLWTTARPASARVLPFDHKLSGILQGQRDDAAKAARRFIDPVP